jgi:4-oxalocrotonate tautomerase
VLLQNGSEPGSDPVRSQFDVRDTDPLGPFGKKDNQQIRLETPRLSCSLYANRSELVVPGKQVQYREEGSSMPYVNIKITREGATSEQKARLIREVTRLLAEILGKNPQTTVIVIDEVETDNWGIGGETVSERRQREKKCAPPNR